MDRSLPADLAEQADLFVDLACLTYSPRESMARRRRAERLLDRHPGLVGASLGAAAVVGDVDGARRLLDADPSAVHRPMAPRGWNALLYLCYGRVTSPRQEWDPLAVARLLLDRGADPNSHVILDGTYRFTALTGAMGEGEGGPRLQPPHPQAGALARLLLDAGANPNESQGLYNTMFLPGTEWIELLLSYGLSAADRVNWEPERMSMLDYLLGTAVRRGFSDRVVLLLAHGASPDGRDWYNGRTHYENAVLDGRTDIVDLLLRAGVPPVPLSPAEEFRAACLRGDDSAIRRLYAPRPEDRDDAAILIDVAARGQLPTVRLLLDLGVPAGARGDRGVTAVHKAAGGGHLAVVRELVERGAAVDAREDQYGATPVGWTSYGAEHWPKPGQAEVLRYLLDRSGDVFELVWHGRVDRLAELLGRDADLARARDREGRTPLHCLSEAAPSVDEVIDLLVRHGADVNATDDELRTPLDVVTEAGWEEAAAALRRRGARRTPNDLIPM